MGGIFYLFISKSSIFQIRLLKPQDYSVIPSCVVNEITLQQLQKSLNIPIDRHLYLHMQNIFNKCQKKSGK